MNYQTKRLIILKYEQGLDIKYIIPLAMDSETGKTKARHIVEEVIYEHLMESKAK